MKNFLSNALKALSANKRRAKPKVSPGGVVYYKRSQGGYPYIHVVDWGKK